MPPAAVLPSAGRFGPTAVASQLPLRTEPHYLSRLAALVKADLKARQAAGERVDIDEYRLEFPELFVRPSTDLTSTPMPCGSRTAATAVTPMPEPLGNPLADDPFPRVGAEFHGYALLEELGRGAFARVYLAAEHRLADRPVALKVTAAASGEPRRLARLQHTNVVPIQTAFEAGGMHVVQMPFFGRQTLADVLDKVRAERAFPHVSGAVFSTVARVSTAYTPPPTSPPEPAPARLADPAPLPGPFAGKSYPDAVLWLMTRLADGLAHAHARDILHLDLKPQNVLMADDGQPMLLDFNLSLDRRTGDRDRVGGTWPYMPPEQIEEYAGTNKQPVDARADLFALGVIFFELLTLRHPFPPVRSGPGGLAEAVGERRAGAPSARAANPEVSPAVDAIVRKLLAADPADRYPSAEALREDLIRQQENRPLRFAPDRSPSERLGKVRRRYPRLLPTAGLAIALAGLAAGGWALAAATAERDAQAAAAKGNAVRAELTTLRLDLTSLNETTTRAGAVETVRRWLDQYPTVEKHLSAADRTALRSAVGEAALLAAEAEWRDARGGPEAERPAATERAAELCRRADAVYGDAAPAAVRRLTAELNGTELPVAGVTSVDLFVDAVRLCAGGRYRDAVPVLEQLVSDDPGHFAGQFALGVCLGQLGRHERAAERMRMAQPLAPQDPRPRANIGLVLIQSGKPAAAVEELTAALKVRPTDAPVLYVRGVARLRSGKAADAVADLTAALDAGYDRLPALAARAEAYARSGNPTAAAADRAAVLAAEPVTPTEFIARGNCLAGTDPERALADYRKATADRPDLLAGWQNQAAVLSRLPDRADEALSASEQAARFAPQFAPARVGYAVLLARAGRRDEAHAEAQAGLLLGDDPGTVYRAGCVYALTARTHPGDATAAFDLVRRAIALGYRELPTLDADDDLSALRTDARYAALAAAYRTLGR